jgi:DNA-binding MarR family transcriptional regulator
MSVETTDEALVRELFGLMRGLKGLHNALPPGHGFKLEGPAYGVLWAIAARGSVRPSALAEHLCLDLSTVSRHLSSLSAAGYLAREADPADKRAHLIRVSPAGEELLEAEHQVRVDGVSALVADFSEAERKRFLRCLVHFNTNLDIRRRQYAEASVGSEEGRNKA